MPSLWRMSLSRNRCALLGNMRWRRAGVRSIFGPGGLRLATGETFPRGLIDLEGSCPWPDPWVRTHGAHLLCRFPGSTSPPVVVDRHFPSPLRLSPTSASRVLERVARKRVRATRFKLLSLMHVVLPKPLPTFGRHALGCRFRDRAASPQTLVVDRDFNYVGNDDGYGRN